MKKNLLITIPKLPADNFGLSEWRAGIAIWELIGNCCEQNIFDNKEILRKYAIGYIPADGIMCRPRHGEFAVMFIIDDVFCWTHFMEKEFVHVFTE
jgi:hypothetical protein